MEWKGSKSFFFKTIWLCCICSEKRDKLDPKAVKCYFIGYDPENYGYRCWEPKGKKILRHCDVTFDETKLYKDVFGNKYEITEIVGVEKELVETGGIDGRDVIVPKRVEQHRDEIHS